MNDLTEYYKHRDNMDPGDGISFRGDGAISGAIEFFTGQERSHWGTVGDWVDFDGTQDPRLPLYEAAGGEYNIRSLSKKLMYYEGEVYWHPLKPEFDGYRQAMHRKMWELVGVEYDYSSLLKNIFGRQPADEAELFCSEAGGVLVLEIPHEALLPMADNEYLAALIDGQALRPGGMALLPIWEPERRLI